MLKNKVFFFKAVPIENYCIDYAHHYFIVKNHLDELTNLFIRNGFHWVFVRILWDLCSKTTASNSFDTKPYR